ncbi:Prohibitin [Corchorus capsularis]|uniref:Prohibitin n=1 Tax=Corchorus capsularis TaxID=210143 RepID=A0A1R3HG76_COCAP|nr:Prohibitin [Corchorus capsularis]
MNLNNVKVPKMPGGGALPALLKLGVIGGLGIYPEGTHFMVPWFERPVIYDVRARSHLIESTSVLVDSSREIRRILTERARYFNILLGDASITSLTFGKEFTAAIEAKQVAAQEAERTKFIV